MQTPLFELPQAVAPSIIAYHDESGHIGRNERFLFHGVLFVPQAVSGDVLIALGRERGRYGGCIHYADISDRDRDKGAAVRAWMNAYGKHIGHVCPYKCFVVDLHSPAFDRSRFREPFQIYNTFAATAIWSGLRWSFDKTSSVQLRIVSESKSRSAEDNFVSYVPASILAKAHGKLDVQFDSPALITVAGDPKAVQPEHAGHCEFLQLTDLLTSAIAEAVLAKAIRSVKQDLAGQIGQWIADTRELPWLQEHGLHRRFSVSCFPGPGGGYIDVDLAIKRRNQAALS